MDYKKLSIEFAKYSKSPIINGLSNLSILKNKTNNQCLTTRIEDKRDIEMNAKNGRKDCDSNKKSTSIKCVIKVSPLDSLNVISTSKKVAAQVKKNTGKENSKLSITKINPALSSKK